MNGRGKNTPREVKVLSYGESVKENDWRQEVWQRGGPLYAGNHDTAGGSWSEMRLW